MGRQIGWTTDRALADLKQEAFVLGLARVVVPPMGRRVAKRVILARALGKPQLVAVSEWRGVVQRSDSAECVAGDMSRRARCEEER